MTSDRPRRRPRKLSDEDRRLWDAVARSVNPLRRSASAADAEEGGAPQPAAAVEHPAPPPAKSKPPGQDRQRRVAPAAPVAPPLSPLARRERQRLSRGTLAIDARIDLHGLTQSEAHAALARFLRLAQADDAKFVLVITGKGARSADRGTERGVLRRQVPLWLGLPEFRAYVVGFEDADTAHGGQGALYVRLRRRRAGFESHT